MAAWVEKTGDRVLRALSRGPLTVDQIATLTGKSPGQVRAAISHLRRKGQVGDLGSGRPKVYRVLDIVDLTEKEGQ